MTTNYVVSRVSKSTIKPSLVSEESQKPFHLTPWDLQTLNLEYYQFGLAFARPQGSSMSAILGQLKTSLATALTYFFPLSGRLVTQHQLLHHHVWINCKDSPGVEFIHSVANNATVSDVLSDHAVTTLFPSLFPLDPGTLNSHGHTLPLLVVQVTELFDGIFIAFACNHVVADGVSFWHFTNSWSEICRKQKQPSEKLNQECVTISRPPIMRRWFLNNQNYSIISLPNSTALPHPIPCDTTVKQRVFHFTSKSIARIKAKANVERNYTDRISSFQAVIAFTWRSTTLARRLLPDQNTTCVFLVDSRSRLDPPLSENYFGNCSLGGFVTCTAGELLSNNLGWAAWMLHKEISNHTYHTSIRPFLEEFTKAPSLDSYADITDMNALIFGSSPRFDVYGNDFGWGDPVALRWYATPVDGFVQSAPGRDRGSVDLMTCLSTETMGALEANDEFMHAVSLTNLGMRRSHLCSRY